MKNRTEEYWDLVGELSRPPKELEGSVGRAGRRARRAAPLRRLTAAAASFAAVAAAFVALVNAFPAFALACSGVPVVRELAAAAAFSPSLSAAVTHDCVQYIGQSRTVDGVTVKLEYAIVDKHQAVFFYSVDGERPFYTTPHITTPDGEAVGGYATSSTYANGQDGLDAIVLSFTGGESTLPERFTMEMYFKPLPERDHLSAPDTPSDTAPPEQGDSGTLWDDPLLLRFAFDVTLDPARISGGRTVEVGKWLELDGQRILVDRLELFPTRTIVYLGEDGGNSAWLRSLTFSFEDGKGRVYDDIDGTLSASGETDSKSYLTYYFQSFYYDLPEHLTLNVSTAAWLDKDAARVVLDLSTGACSGLPEGVSIESVTPSGDGSTVAVRVVSRLSQAEFGQIFGHTYRDPEGNEHYFTHMGSGTYSDEEKTGSYELIYFDDYPWDTAELELSRTGFSRYDPVVRVPLF